MNIFHSFSCCLVNPHINMTSAQWFVGITSILYAYPFKKKIHIYPSAPAPYFRKFVDDDQVTNIFWSFKKANQFTFS